MPLQDATEFARLPYSLEAEQSVLGALILQPDSLADALKYIGISSFYLKQHQLLFSVIARLFTEGKPVDIITVLDQALKDQVFDTEENAKLYLTRLIEMVPTVSNLEQYCKIVREKEYARALITAAEEILTFATDGSSDADTMLDAAEQKIYQIRGERFSSSLRPIHELIHWELDHLEALQEQDGSDALSSGFSSLDATLTGLNPSDLIILAARPAMGKTSFALNLAVNAARRSQKQVAIFSLEMSSQQLVQRMISSESQIPSPKLRTGFLNSEEWASLAVGAQRLSEVSLYLDDTPNITVTEIKGKLRRLPKLGLVVIDYLQLMSTGRRDGNRVQEISEITRNLKIMAKELSVPVIALSQLARGPEARQDHRPLLSDLRESGSIEQDADIVLFLYRDEYYNPENGKIGIAECIIAKNRHGEVGNIELSWNGQFTRFSSLDRIHHE